MRRPWPTTPYVRPSHFRENADAQKVRISKEMADLSLQHSLKMGKAALRDLETSLMQGNVFDETTARIVLTGKLRVEGVNPAHIEAVVATFLPQYLSKVGGEGTV